jgi:imidazolonepropionase-like amidohydrolase
VTGNLITAVSAEPLAVAAHTFTDTAVRVSLEAGGKSIEHGFLMNRETMELIKEHDAWHSVQPLLDDEDRFSFNDPVSQKKWIDVTNGTDFTCKMAKEGGVKAPFGADILKDHAAARQTRLAGAFVRRQATKV